VNPRSYNAPRRVKLDQAFFDVPAQVAQDDRVVFQGIERREDSPFILVCPQCPRDQWWDNDVLNALLDEIIARHPVDTECVYLTGISMGGFGTWSLAIEHPERFAAIAPICGGGPPYVAHRLERTPVWAFHGARDDIVPLQESERMVEAVRAAGGDAKLTIYPEAGHNSWTETYKNPELYEWFLGHRRAASKAT